MTKQNPGDDEFFCEFCDESSYEVDLSGCDCCSVMVCPECHVECGTEVGDPMCVCPNCVKKYEVNDDWPTTDRNAIQVYGNILCQGLG